MKYARDEPALGLPPDDACGSYRVLYAGLHALQEDIHQHVQLESCVLFPAALALELEQAG